MVLLKKTFLFKKNQKDKLFLQKFKETKYNVLIIADYIKDDEFGKEVIDFSNYCIENKIGVVLLTKFNYYKMVISSKVYVAKNSIFKRKTIKRICKNYSIDDIIVYDYNSFQLVHSIKGALNIPITFCFLNMINIKNEFDYLRYKKIVSADVIACFSEEVCNYLLNNYDFDNEKLHLFHFCADDNIFDTKKITSCRIKNLSKVDKNIDLNKKFFYCFVNFNNIKSIISMLNAIKLINNKNVIYILSGSFTNTYKSRMLLIQKIKELNLQNIVKISKTISDKPSMYISAYAVIDLLNENEFSKAFCEAGFMKKPVIIIYNSYVNKNIIDGKTGFIAKDRNIFDIKSAISKVLDLSKDEYKEICNSAYEYVSMFCNKNDVYSKIDETIFECIKNHQKKKNKNKKSKVLESL